MTFGKYRENTFDKPWEQINSKTTPMISQQPLHFFHIAVDVVKNKKNKTKQKAITVTWRKKLALNLSLLSFVKET